MQLKINLSHYLRNFSLAFFPVTILVCLMFFYVYNSEIKADIRIIKTTEVDHLNVQQAIIANDFQAVADDLIMISNLSELQKLVNANNQGKSGLVNDLLSISQAKKRYDQIRYLDETGMEIVRINFNNGQPLNVPPDKLQNKAERYYFRDTIELNKEYLFISPWI